MPRSRVLVHVHDKKWSHFKKIKHDNKNYFVLQVEENNSNCLITNRVVIRNMHVIKVIHIHHSNKTCQIQSVQIQSNHLHLDHHMVIYCAGFHMDNPWTLLLFRRNPQSPLHVDPTPTPWLEPTHYVISSRWCAASCRGCDCCPRPRRLKQVSTLNGCRRKRVGSSHRTRLCQHSTKSEGVRCAWVLCSFRTNTCRQGADS